MSVIKRIFSSDFPNRPAPENGALEYQVGPYIVYATGGEPTQAEMDAVLNPSLSSVDQQALNDALAAEGSVVRGLALVVLDIANGVIPIKTGAPLYTTTQLKSLIKAKMR